MEESITEPIDMSQLASGAGADATAVRSEDAQATQEDTLSPRQPRLNLRLVRRRVLLNGLKSKLACVAM